MDYSPWGHKESDTTEPLTLGTELVPINYTDQYFKYKWNGKIP